ncbi:hypothetical protein BJY01DRAFT_255398 [Aspergillus pseudoustus]|uniref:SGNH hydrolase-type esterase domain-containing protein n=1 Tax=Aspergillus pseudoustus TaxID=1810923 RepID=A0ABR4IKN6_9EURO
MAPPGPFRTPRQRQRQRQSVWAMLTAFILLAMMGVQLAHAADLQPRAPIANGVELRVLALGDSITYGAGDANYNGYRGPLYARLTARGNTVDMVGRQRSGTFADTAHEGYRGFFISEIGASSSLGRYAAPNIVLMHAGTNDMHKNIDILNAPSRLGDLIELVFETAPDAVIFVAQIIPANNAVKQARINDFNAAVPRVVQGFLDKGKKVVIVRMDRALSVADLHDELHPSVAGYAKMADAWYEAIEAADVDGLITKPGKAMAPPPTPAGPENCRPSPNWYKTGAKALGPQAAYNDGPFKPNWAKRGVIAGGACPRSKVHFFDLDGDGLKDYGCVQPQNGATSVWRNIPDANGRASGEWEALGEIATGRDGRDGTGVMFADLNGDGFDDYIYVADNGEVEGFINLGSRNADGVWRWKGLGRIAGGVGATNETLQLVDLNGDGRADFCIVNQETGEVTGWWNTGISDMPDYHKVGVIATGESFGPDSKVILADLSGNGRADYLMVGLHGKMTGFINRRQEKGVVPRWMMIFDVADGPEGTEQDEVFLVDITGDGKADYLRVNEKNGRTELWENLGTGGKFQVGDGVMLADLNGDGVADYFWVDQDGRGYGYINAGGPLDAWHSVGRIAEGTGNGRSRVHTAVLTSSGRADYVVVEESIGQASWWENLGPDTDYAWQARGVFATGPKNTVETKFGWKFDSRNVRFAEYGPLPLCS